MPGREPQRDPGKIPYLRVRPPKRVAGVVCGAEPLARIAPHGAGLLRLRGRVDAASRAGEGMASSDLHREADGRRYEPFVRRADGRGRLGGPRGPDKPDYAASTWGAASPFPATGPRGSIQHPA